MDLANAQVKGLSQSGAKCTREDRPPVGWAKVQPLGKIPVAAPAERLS